MYARKETTLPNGLRVVWEHRPSYQSVAVTCIVGAGSRDDDKHRKGLAHCVEHMIMESLDGSSQSPVFRSIMDSGGWINATTTLDSTVFEIGSHRDDALDAIKSLARLLGTPPTNQHLLDREKSVIREEMGWFGQDDKNDVQAVKFRLMGASDSLGHSIGTYRMVGRIDVDDVRRFREKFYVAENMVIAIVGGLDVEAALGEITEAFGAIPRGQANNIGPWTPVQGPRCQFKQGLTFCGISMFFACRNLSGANFPAVEMLTEVFASMPCSRLQMRLRAQEAMVYSVGGRLSLLRDAGTVDVDTMGQLRNTDRMIAGILDEATRLAAQPIPEDEFDKLKEQFIKRQLLYLEGPHYASSWYAYAVFFDRYEIPGDLDQWAALIRQLTPTDFQRAAQDLFRPENMFAYIGGKLGFLKRRRILRMLANVGR